MPRKKETISHSDYSLELRIKNHNGQWGDWQCRGEGKWLGLEHVQNQIKMLKKAYNRTMEIKFMYKGHLLDYNGNETDKTILYEKSEH